MSTIIRAAPSFLRISGLILLSLAFVTGWPGAPVFAQSGFKTKNARADQGSQRSHIPYDDSSLTTNRTPVSAQSRDSLPTPPFAMPYNRWIDPAGGVVRFGDPKLENHSLDAILLPGKKVLAVEDRYGIILFNTADRHPLARYHFPGDPNYKGLMSLYSGIKAIEYNGAVHIFWGAGAPGKHDSYVMEAVWDGTHLELLQAIPFQPLAPAPMALPNEVAVQVEEGELYLYVVLNGNNQLTKMRLSDRAIIWTAPTGVAPFGLTIAGGKAYVTNWAGPVPVDTPGKETSGVPWGLAYTDPRTGATIRGTVTVVDPSNGNILKEIEVGLHPNAILHSPDESTIYVANGNSDNISVISTATMETVGTIPVSLFEKSDHYAGSTPDALAIDSTGRYLYVANGLNNAVAVISRSRTGGSRTGAKTEGADGPTEGANGPTDWAGAQVLGFIPTEAYPSGIVCDGSTLYVTNLEAIGSRSQQNGAYNSHWEQASVSFIPLPDQEQLNRYTEKVRQLNLSFRELLSRQLPRPRVRPQPVPERIGEPSVFKHVVYIIKENRTYDQVLGDMPQGRGMPSFCVFGDSVTPNQHQLAKDFSLLDNYYVSGKSSAEGHQWTDAAMVTDYVERMVRTWFRSYPHAQYDAMVYDKEGFIWNNALDHGKTVRIYGEACRTEMDPHLDWTQIYQSYQANTPFEFRNVTTISRVRPILSDAYPGYDDPRITDQWRAQAFIDEMKKYEARPGDEWPELMVMSLPNDHTTGMSPGFPTPRAMVADNDLALGRIVEAISKSRFWDSTVIFVTEDDSQAGWDHISAYRTTGFVISPYSRLQKTVSTNYNQTSLVRTIEQILGIPPMNAMDATALPMFDCFTAKPDPSSSFTVLPNKIPLNEMNRQLSQLKGRDLHYASMSLKEKLDEIDEGDDDVFNRILWWAMKGSRHYPQNHHRQGGVSHQLPGGTTE